MRAFVARLLGESGRCASVGSTCTQPPRSTVSTGAAGILVHRASIGVSGSAGPVVRWIWFRLIEGFGLPLRRIWRAVGLLQHAPKA